MVFFCCFRQLADQRFGVVGFEFMRVHIQQKEIGDTIGNQASLEETRMLHQGIQSCKTSRASTLDNQFFGVCQPGIDQGFRAFDHILQVNFAPVAFESISVAAPKTGAAAIVDRKVRVTPTGKVGGFQIEGIENL